MFWSGWRADVEAPKDPASRAFPLSSAQKACGCDWRSPKSIAA